jgi:hypothetical protein
MSDRVGIATGEGDCPGLNAVIRAVAKAAAKRGRETIGFLGGYEGILEPQRYVPLDYQQLGPLLTRGGTVLGTTSRGRLAAKVGHGQTRRLPQERIDGVRTGLRHLGVRGLVARESAHRSWARRREAVSDDRPSSSWDRPDRRERRGRSIGPAWKPLIIITRTTDEHQESLAEHPGASGHRRGSGLGGLCTGGIVGDRRSSPDGDDGTANRLCQNLGSPRRNQLFSQKNWRFLRASSRLGGLVTQ